MFVNANKINRLIDKIDIVKYAEDCEYRFLSIDR